MDKFTQYSNIQALVQKEAQDIANKAIQDNNKKSQYKVEKISSHLHNGTDSQRISYANIAQRLVFIHWTIPGTQAATATNYGVIWTAPVACTVVAISEVHQTAGTNGGAVTLQLERLQGTEAPDAGDEILVTALSLKTTANTVQYGTITPVRTTGTSVANLALGDRLCLKDAGTLTAVANMTVVITIQF